MRLKLFGFFGILYRQACQNCSLRAHKNNFKLLNFKEKFTISGSFSEDEQKFFNFLANSVHKVGETACDASLAINWRFIFFFSKKMNFFIFSYGEKFQLFVDKTSAELSKMLPLDTKDTLRKKLFLNSTCSWEHFKPLFFYWKSFHFFSSSKKLRSFFQNVFSRIAKFGCFLSIGTSSGQCCVSLERNSFFCIISGC